MMKKVIYNYHRSPKYFSRLFSFFFFISFSLTFSLYLYFEMSFLNFILQFFIIFFLILVLSSIVEYFYKGDYMNPMEKYDVIFFVDCFLRDKGIGDKYYLKYSSKFRNSIERRLSSGKYYISTISKTNNVYKVTLINERKLFEYFFIKFLVRNVFFVIYIKKVKGSFKVIYAK